MDLFQVLDFSDNLSIGAISPGSNSGSGILIRPVGSLISTPSSNNPLLALSATSATPTTLPIRPIVSHLAPPPSHSGAPPPPLSFLQQATPYHLPAAVYSHQGKYICRLWMLNVCSWTLFLLVLLGLRPSEIFPHGGPPPPGFLGIPGTHPHAHLLGGGAGLGTGKRKKSWTRAVFSHLQRKGLEKRFQVQKYITKPDRRQLAASLGLTDAQVIFFYKLCPRAN